MKKHGVVFSSVMLAVWLLSAGSSTAQTTGSIRGTVETQGTPLPGVTVEAKSPTSRGAERRSRTRRGDST